MCRVLAYVGPETPLESLLLTPSNSLVNQALDPEHYPDLQLAGWGFAAWSEHLLKPEDPFHYRRPMAAFYDDNAHRIVPSLQASTMLAHVRAAAYDSSVVMVDENCHPFSFDQTPWIIAQNGDLPHWMLLQRELLPHCEDRYLAQMRGTTDTEFLYVLLLSLLEGDSDGGGLQGGAAEVEEPVEGPDPVQPEHRREGPRDEALGVGGRFGVRHVEVGTARARLW